MNLYVKLGKHITTYLITQPNDVGSRSTAAIHQHQGLTRMYAGSTHAAPFPATLVDKPACGNLLMIFINIIMRHLRIGRKQGVKL